MRSILHRDYIRSGKLETEWGKRYDWLFDHRQQADYRPLVTFAADEVREVIKEASEFVEKMETMIQRSTP